MHRANIHIRVPRWCWCIYYIYVYTNIYAIGACALSSALLPTTRHLAWSPGRTVAWPKNLSNSHFPFCFAPFSWRPKAHFCMRALSQLFRLVCWGACTHFWHIHTLTKHPAPKCVCVCMWGLTDPSWRPLFHLWLLGTSTYNIRGSSVVILHPLYWAWFEAQLWYWG